MTAACIIKSKDTEIVEISTNNLLYVFSAICINYSAYKVRENLLESYI